MFDAQIYINFASLNTHQADLAGGSVLTSGAQPPASDTQQIPVDFGLKFYCHSRTDGGRTAEGQRKDCRRTGEGLRKDY